MRRLFVAASAWMCLLTTATWLPRAAAGERATVVVFDVESRGPRLPKQSLENLTEYLAAALAEVGYHVVPPERAHKVMAEKKIPCQEDDCRSAVARMLGADHFLSCRLLQVVESCKLTATLHDVLNPDASQTVSTGGGCTGSALLGAATALAQRFRRVRLVPPKAEQGETAPSWESETGRLSLNSDPPGRVWIDGVDTGKMTPLVEHELPAGRHRILVDTPKGSLQAHVDIWHDESTSLMLRSHPGDLVPTEGFGWLLVNTTPWSEVSIDGQYVGMTPGRYRLMPGQHLISFQFAHGEKKNESVTIEPGKLTKLVSRAETPGSFRYNKGMGLLKLHCTPWAQIWVDGQQMGIAAPVFAHQLPGGRHKVAIHFSTGRYMTEVVEILPGKTFRKIIREE